MRLDYSPKFREKFKKLPKKIQIKFSKQAKLLKDNLRHPSLRAKKYDEDLGVWQSRVDYSYRFYFLIKNDTYIVVDIKKHPK